jgi:hypothetical protein
MKVMTRTGGSTENKCCMTHESLNSLLLGNGSVNTPTTVGSGVIDASRVKYL